nr:SDR family oxidoreductase [uncultured Lichenicoccus sp.]
MALRGTSIYSASTGGISALTRAAVVEPGPLRIRVGSVNPSIIRTPMTESRISRDASGAEAHPSASGIPLGRHAEPQEMAQLALFLLSDRLSYVNGQALAADGGQSAR